MTKVYCASMKWADFFPDVLSEFDFAKNEYGNYAFLLKSDFDSTDTRLLFCADNLWPESTSTDSEKTLEQLHIIGGGCNLKLVCLIFIVCNDATGCESVHPYDVVLSGKQCTTWSEVAVRFIAETNEGAAVEFEFQDTILSCTESKQLLELDILPGSRINARPGDINYCAL